MKKGWLLFLIVIIVAIGSFTYFFYFRNNIKSSENKEKYENIIINGEVIDVSMNNVSIKTSNNSVYTFSIVDLVHDEFDLGDSISISYNGKIDTKKDIQSATVNSVTVLSRVEFEKYPDEYNDDGLFKEYYGDAYDRMTSMSLSEKVGQILLVRVPESNQVKEITKYQFGGLILFGRDTKNKTRDELVNNINSYQSASNIPLVIATDEEGGSVVRISNNRNLNSYTFASPQEVYTKGGFDAIYKDTIEKSNMLVSLGINMNLAPVADVSTSSDDYIYNRSFGKNGILTSQFVSNVIKASHENTVTYTLKHFPGYGNNLNTHTGISEDKREYKTFVNSDFLPFEAGFEENAEAVLVNHNIVLCMDDVPASLSSNVHNILRNDLGFSGIIMTDDLAMDAIHDYVEKPYVQAIKAGNDMLIVSDYKTGYNEIMNALEDGTLKESEIDRLVFRVLAYKYYKGLIK